MGVIEGHLSGPGMVVIEVIAQDEGSAYRAVKEPASSG
ncbi:DUF6207 family protein [Streptomyces rhizoryzae]